MRICFSCTQISVTIAIVARHQKNVAFAVAARQESSHWHVLVVDAVNVMIVRVDVPTSGLRC